jgi:putative spermidine/putrescine transport system ATP-binding protein
LTPAIEFRAVTRSFGELRAVDAVSMAVGRGEFFAMLGPSGSGKTTCLRLVAGFEAPDAGQVLLDGQDVSTVPPWERSVNTVFQDYALFPHMTVAQNVAYGLRVRKVDAATCARRAGELLELVKLAGLGARRPAQLSGGQRQRVALARALANEPQVLLLDEPLGALDLKLREEMQVELKRLQRSLGITFVYVTHDQGEALSMADRVAVFSQGRIEQLDAPRQLYSRPETAFVARFVGSSNVAEAPLAARLSGQAQPFAVRAEHVRVQAEAEPAPAQAMQATGTVLDLQFHGAMSRWQVELDGGGTFAAAAADTGTASSLGPGARVRLWWLAEHALRLRAN